MVSKVKQHYDNSAVDGFSWAMKRKLSNSSKQDDWKNVSVEYLQHQFLDSVSRGDPVEVANFAMMLWYHGGKTLSGYPIATNNIVGHDFVTHNMTPSKLLGDYLFHRDAVKESDGFGNSYRYHKEQMKIIADKLDKAIDWK